MWVALVKAILDWLTDLVKQDVKAGDADATPKSLKDRWHKRIKEHEKKVKKNENDSGVNSE